MNSQRARLFPTLLVLLLVALPAAADRSYKKATEADMELDPQVQALLDRFEQAQKTTETMTAHFRQTREEALFADAKIIEGDFWFTHPTNFRWEYEDAEAGPVVFLATKDVFQRWIPSLNVVQQTDIAKKSRRVFSYFGIGKDVDNLRRRFDIQMGDASDYEGTDKLELRGRWRRVKKRLDVLEMWIDKERALPVAVRIVLPDGGSTTWEFRDMIVNPDIAAETYALALPPDVQIRAEDKKLTATDELLNDILEEEKANATPAEKSDSKG